MATTFNGKTKATLQLYSRDYSIRLSIPMLRKLALEHLCSEQDDQVSLDAMASGHPLTCCTGYTEWHGAFQQQPVSLAWDWVLTHDGMVKEVTRSTPRTNLRLTDIHGYDMPDDATTAWLWQAIGRLPWSERVSQALQE